MKYFGIIFKVAVHVVCVVHMITILHASLYPEEASIRVYQKNLSDIELPVVFQICLIENLGGADRTRKLGYKNMKHFFRGISMYDETEMRRGWAGHTKNGSTIGNRSVLLQKLFLIKL